MKRFLIILAMCFAIQVIMTPNAQANRGKAAKALIDVIKGSRKTPRIIRSKPSRPVKPRIRPRTTTVTCSRCNGNGRVTFWDSYSGQYNSIRCSKCNGSGKVRSN